MTNMLLISNTLDNINVAWRHFANSEFNANATTNYDSALDNIRSQDRPELIVYYFSKNTTDFMTFYRIIRQDESMKKIPLLILADAEQQTVLSRYVNWDNAHVVGISIIDSKLYDIVNDAIKNGFPKKEKAAPPAAEPEDIPDIPDQPKEPDYTKPKII